LHISGLALAWAFGTLKLGVLGLGCVCASADCGSLNFSEPAKGIHWLLPQFVVSCFHLPITREDGIASAFPRIILI
jgi:hypothetical protein